MNCPLSGVSGCLFFSFVAHVSPQTIQLATLDTIVFHQHLFHRLRMFTRIPQPTQNGVFFVPFDTAQTADATAFRQQGQRFENLVFGCAFLVKERAVSDGDISP
jgi:hypothetical protein